MEGNLAAGRKQVVDLRAGGLDDALTRGAGPFVVKHNTAVYA